MSEGIFYPAVGGDDGFRYYDNDFDNTGPYVELGNWESLVYKHGFFRFPNVNIPEGSTIDSAIIRLQARYNDTGTVNINCHLNDVANTVAPTSGSDFDALVLTGAVAWDDVPDWTADIDYDSPELNTLLQGIIDKGAWVSGNAVTVILKENVSAYDKVRRAKSYEYSTTLCARLIVEWTEPPPPPTSIIDVKTDIEAFRSKWWLKTEIQTVGTTFFADLDSEIEAVGLSLSDVMSEIDVIYPTRSDFLLLRYDHIPERDAQNVQTGKAMQFRLYNPDPAFGIDLTTFKLRFDEGTWYRYGDSRLTFTEITYREYRVYFNPPNFDYNSEIMIEVYCEDHLNNPGIKLEIL